MTREKNRENLKAARARMYRELVFECAERLFAEGGFDSTAIQDIANEAGISLNTLYSAYPGKGEIYADIVATRRRGLVEAVSEVFVSDASALEQLESGIRAYTRFLIEHAAYFGILLREGRNWGLAPHDAQLRESWETGLGMTSPLMQRGIDEGVFYDGDAELLASSVQALMQTILAALIMKVREPDADEISQEILRHVCRLLCRPDSAAARSLRVV